MKELSMFVFIITSFKTTELAWKCKVGRGNLELETFYILI